MAAVVLKSVPIARPSPTSSHSSSRRMAMVSSLWVGDSPGLRVEKRRRRARFEVECSGRNKAPDTGVPDVTTKTWQSSVLESDIPVLVDFWAPWCGPCRIILPLIEELSQQYAGKLKCVKLNTDESPEIPTQYGIRSIPTIIIFKNGEKKDSIIGAVPKASLTTSIEKFI